MSVYRTIGQCFSLPRFPDVCKCLQYHNCISISHMAAPYNDKLLPGIPGRLNFLSLGLIVVKIVGCDSIDTAVVIPVVSLSCIVYSQLD